MPVLSYIKLLWISCNCFFVQSSFSACLKDYRYLMFAWSETEWQISAITRGKKLEREDGGWSSSKSWEGSWLGKELTRETRIPRTCMCNDDLKALVQNAPVWPSVSWHEEWIFAEIYVSLMQRIRLKWSFWFHLASKTLMANLFRVPLKEDSDAVLHLELFSSQLVPPSKGNAEKSLWNLLSVLAWGSKGAAQHFPTPVVAERSQGERAWGVARLPVLVLLPCLLPEDTERRSGTEKLQCWELDCQEKSQVCSSLGRWCWLVGLCCVFLARNQSVTEQQLYLRQNSPVSYHSWGTCFSLELSVRLYPSDNTHWLKRLWSISLSFRRVCFF